MENLSFVLWMCLYPPSVSASNYLVVKYRKEANLSEIQAGSFALAALINLVIWLFVGYLLYK